MPHEKQGRPHRILKFPRSLLSLQDRKQPSWEEIKPEANSGGLKVRAGVGLSSSVMLSLSVLRHEIGII